MTECQLRLTYRLPFGSPSDAHSDRPSVPLSTNRGSLNGIHPLTLPFTALLWDVGVIIARKTRFVNPFFVFFEKMFLE